MESCGEARRGMYRCRLRCPEGTTENSPALQRQENGKGERVPEGRLKSFAILTPHFSCFDTRQTHPGNGRCRPSTSNRASTAAACAGPRPGYEFSSPSTTTFPDPFAEPEAH